MDDDLLAEQLRYYRDRAEEYDETAYGNVAAARARTERMADRMPLAGDVLEIACGTGIWTEALARRAKTVTALDAAPETIAVARRRVGTANVRFVVADVFEWRPGTQFDVVFFGAFLSHVPWKRFHAFWDQMRALVKETGRVVFVDEHVDEHDKEEYLVGEAEIIRRELRDGRQFRVVKNFIDPDQMIIELNRLGWMCQIVRDGADYVIGEAVPQ